MSEAPTVRTIDQIKTRHKEVGRTTLRGAPPPGDWFARWMDDVDVLLNEIATERVARARAEAGKNFEAYTEALAGIGEAREERDRALASAAVLLHWAREALVEVRDHTEIDCACAPGAAMKCQWHEQIDATLKALDGGEDVREALRDLAYKAYRLGRTKDDPAERPTMSDWTEEDCDPLVDAALASPPALPDPAEALAAAFAWAIERRLAMGQGREPDAGLADLARRWLAGEGR